MLAGCAAVPSGGQLSPMARPVTVYVVTHGWHTGIVMRLEDVPQGAWPEHRDFPGARYVEVGWGDRDFYQAPEPTSGLALTAAFRSRGSVLYVTALDAPPGGSSAPPDVLPIRLSLEEAGQLAAFIGRAHARDESGRAIPLPPGPWGPGRFYLATERYLLLRTCNTWTAKALQAAGCAMRPFLAFAAGAVMAQARAGCAGAVGERAGQRAAGSSREPAARSPRGEG
jgi:uncharacterized protein (TIGR02117 family)